MDEIDRIVASFEKAFPDCQVTAFRSPDPLRSSSVRCEVLPFQEEDDEGPPSKRISTKPAKRAVEVRIVGSNGFGVRDLRLDLREEIFPGLVQALMRAAAILRG